MSILPRALLEAGINPDDLEAASDFEALYRKFAKTSENKARLLAMESIAESMLPILTEQFDSDPMLLNVENGTLDLRSGELRPHRPEDYITNLAPVQYDAAAECSMWRKFLHDITTGDEELVAYLQRAVGYSLTGSTKEHCLFLLWGSGSNGKRMIEPSVSATKVSVLCA